jgi:hypothetical protein
MANGKLLATIFILSAVIAALHISAIHFFFYWLYWWLDTVVHFWGGLLIALMALWVCERFRHSCGAVCGRSRHAYVAVFSAFVFGVAWEIFEIWAGIPLYDDYVYDTALDLVMDVVGGYVGFVVYSRWLAAPDTSTEGNSNYA